MAGWLSAYWSTVEVAWCNRTVTLNQSKSSTGLQTKKICLLEWIRQNPEYTPIKIPWNDLKRAMHTRPPKNMSWHSSVGGMAQDYSLTLLMEQLGVPLTVRGRNWEDWPLFHTVKRLTEVDKHLKQFVKNWNKQTSQQASTLTGHKEKKISYLQFDFLNQNTGPIKLQLPVLQ